MKVIVNDHEFEVEENDSIDVEQRPCDICGTHTTIYQERNGKTIKKIVPTVEQLSK